jgi:hypothetical protein
VDDKTYMVDETISRFAQQSLLEQEIRSDWPGEDLQSFTAEALRFIPENELFL